MSEVPSQSPAGSAPHRLRSMLLSERLVLYATALYLLAILPVVPEIVSARNAIDIASNVSPLLVVAIGQTFVLITGGIDLSVTSVISMASVVGAAIMGGETGVLAENPVAVPAAILAMVATGALVGAANGLAIARLEMPPFMVTLCTMIFIQGLAEWTTRAESIGDLPASFVYLGYGKVAAIPVSILVAAAIAYAAHRLLDRTVYGRWLYSIGHNRRTAIASGVPASRTLTMAYLLSGSFAGLAGALYTARLETGSPVLGEKLLLDIIGAVVLGGTSLFGGRGRISWTFFGVLFMTVMQSSLAMLRLSFAQVTICKGLLILCAALLDAWRTRLRG